MKHNPIILLFLVLLSQGGLQAQSDRTLFTDVTAATGISFLNRIQEDDSLNVMRYEYLYNGAGVGIGDFNNDGLLDIFFSGNTSPNKLYLNQGKMKFLDVTAAAGVGGNNTWSTGVSVADVNGDGLLDIYVCHSGRYADPQQLSNELFINLGMVNGKLSFRESAQAYGLDLPGTQSTQAAFFDYDRDGDLDMFLLNHSNHSVNPFLNTRKIRATPDMRFGNRLLRQDKGPGGMPLFSDVTLAAGIFNNALNFGLSVTVSDLNQDGWPDIYTTSDYTEQDCFYVNNRTGTFTESLTRSFAHISKYAMGADIADINNDGRPDLFTLDMLPEDNHRQKLLKGADEYDQYHLLLDSGYHHQQMRNMLQLNQGKDDKGNLRFSEIGQLAGISNTDWSWSGLLADFDQDGYKDLFVSNGYLRDFTDLDFLKYAVADAKAAAIKAGNFNYQTYDLVKQMPANKLNNYIYRNDRHLGFTDKSKEWGIAVPGISNAAAYGDLDNDGDLDLVICQNNEPALIYQNNRQSAKDSRYLKLRLKGTEKNSFALGARVTCNSSSTSQYLELYPVRSYQSTVAPELLFAFPATDSIREVLITWPNGELTKLQPTAGDETLLVSQSAARVLKMEKATTAVPRMFHEYTDSSALQFRHVENDFIDYKDEVLLPYQLSRMGPALATADVNGDGLSDVFVGGAIGQAGQLYLQDKAGRFAPAATQPWVAEIDFEDVNAIFFDADRDGDADLYVVSGGNEYGDQSPEFADRLYTNDGKGTFSKSAALPAMLTSKQAVAAGDFDQDGDLDLFVGGRTVPGSFPLPAPSYLLRNDTRDSTVQFTDVTDEVCPALRKPGMVTVAAWSDLDRDQYPELVIAGDWMPVQVFGNKAGKLSDQSKGFLPNGLSGMWSAIQVTDIDKDGDLDILLGNCGNNHQFNHTSEKAPMEMYVADFDDNGRLDPMVCYYIQGKTYPMASRDELLDQIVPLRKKFVKYRDYADATLTDIFPKDKLKAATVLRCETLSSGVLVNTGGHFSFQAFPAEAQVSKVFGFVLQDFDKDGKTDVLVAGNFFPYRVQLGRSDASLGSLLLQTAAGQFRAVDAAVSGIYLDGDIRNVQAIPDDQNNTLIIAAKNDAPVQVIKKSAR